MSYNDRSEDSGIPSREQGRTLSDILPDGTEVYIGDSSPINPRADKYGLPVHPKDSPTYKW